MSRRLVGLVRHPEHGAIAVYAYGNEDPDDADEAVVERATIDVGGVSCEAEFTVTRGESADIVRRVCAHSALVAIQQKEAPRHPCYLCEDDNGIRCSDCEHNKVKA